MRLLIVGANGFLGRAVAKLAIRRDWTVDAVVHRHRQFVPPGATLLTMDDLPGGKTYDAVIIAAAAVASGTESVSRQELRDANIRLVLQIVDHLPLAHIVFCSSVSVYGTPAALPLTEGASYCQPSAYGLSKLAGEAIVQACTRNAIIRFSSLYGEGMAQNTFLPRIVKAARSGTIKLFGDGSRLQDYLHVSDAASLLVAAVEQQAQGVFLGASGQSISNAAAADLVLRNFPGAVIEFEGHDPSPSFVFDTTHTQALLNFAPSIGPAQGIGEFSRA